MKVSIITATLNNQETVEECFRSVYSQSYKNIEHIVIDGGSTDGTMDVAGRYGSRISRLVSEPDNGIYYALNKGIGLATGDIIGFIHADDIYAGPGVVESVVSRINGNNADSCYGDLEYVSRNNTETVIRSWKACPYREGLLKKGWMPPHPTFFVRRGVYEKFGNFNTDLKIAADYELVLRFLGKNGISAHYIPEVLVKMRVGGKSNRNLINIAVKSYEDYRALKLNGMDHAAFTVFLKNVSKLPQFIRR